MGPRVAETGLITTVALAIIAALAVVTILGIVWGARKKRLRDAAQASEIERVEGDGGTPTDPSAPIDEPTAVSSPAAADASAPEPVEARSTASSPPAAAKIPTDPAPLADEPIPAAAPLNASPATVSDPTPATVDPEPTVPAGPPPGDRAVTALKGLGSKVAARLEELGVTTVGDMAALDPAEAETIDARLGPFTGRMARDRWIEQARFLAAGDVKGFEAMFGRL